MQRCIVLVGMPGSGKTTVGRDLAKRLGLRFVDTDHEIEARTGVKIPTIFEIEGEDGFRKRETQTLDDLTRESNMVLATGGGAVIRPENRALLPSGVVVFLSVPPHILWERTRHDRSRPLLQVPDPRGRLEELKSAPLLPRGRAHHRRRRAWNAPRDGEADREGIAGPMRTLSVALDARSYPIHIGTGLLADPA
jgi:shikimate kinase